tara:strand:+ start:261 stop:545 length:285 start_codon:yes stop_codon:yes gene_type:complete
MFDWLSIFKSIILPILIELIGNIGKQDECPDGICPPVVEDLHLLKSELDQPSIQSVGDFLGCLDFQSLLVHLAAIIKLVRNANQGICPGEDPIV